MAESIRITPHVLTATDFSNESKRAFFHALAFAVKQQARMTLLHIGPEGRKEVPWEKYPGVRDTLVDWKLLPQEAQRTDVADQLNISVKKMAMRDENAYNGMVDYIRKHPTDLLIMATEARRGLARLRRSSVAQGVAYTTNSRALLYPAAADDLVDPKTGALMLKKAVFVYDHEPDPASAITWLQEWLPVFGHGPVEVHALYVGEGEDAPAVTFPRKANLTWRSFAEPGNPLKVILGHIEANDIQLVAMMNQRSRGLAGRIRGSLSEQVLRYSKKPLLLLPQL